MTTPEKFCGKNFHTWQTKVKFILMKKGIWDVVSNEREGTSTREATSSWELKNNKALGIIGEALHDTYIHHIDNCETAKIAWVTLENLFGATSRNSKIGLLIKFFGLQKDSKETMSTHINYFKSLLTQLTGIKREIEVDVQIAVLIKSVSDLDEYSTLVTTLINVPSLKLLDVEASLFEEEKRINRKIEQVTNTEAAFFTKKHTHQSSSKFKGKNPGTGKKCTFCGKANHTEDNCFIKQRTKALYVEADEDEDELDQKAKGEEVSYHEANLIIDKLDEEWAF